MKNKKILKIVVPIILIILLCLVVLNSKEQIASILESISNNFNRTLVDEQRYLLIIDGIKATLILSLFSIIIGTILGAIICYFHKSKFKIIRILIKAFINFMQGTPITVLLLIFYYVFFGKINIEPMIVGIIAFSIYFSVYVAEIARASIDSINKSQIMAAKSLGFNKWQIIRYIFLPQAMSYMLPTYKNEVVTLIKLTSIGGYISIFELTKAADVIRNRTYEAFFSLILTAVIYFLICKFVTVVLDIINKKINPRIQKRKLVK